MTELVCSNTPVEEVFLSDGRKVFVKREDLCCPEPGPGFSKMRGVVEHLANRPERTIGVLDTFHSKAGWAVAQAGAAIGKEVINFWPRYKTDPEGVWLPRHQQQVAQNFGAKLIALTAGRSAILYHRARRILKEQFPGSYLMPNALKLSESIEKNAEEVLHSKGSLFNHGSLLLPVSSGTIAAGVIRGYQNAGLLSSDLRVVLHLGYSRSRDAVVRYVRSASGVADAKFEVIDEGYHYADSVTRGDIPFPSNPFYDQKTWRWLTLQKDLPEPIVFWNIGR